MKMKILLPVLLMISLLIVPVYAYGSNPNSSSNPSSGSSDKLAQKLLSSYENLKTFLQNLKGKVDPSTAQRIEDVLSKSDALVEDAKSDLSSGNTTSAIRKLKQALSFIRDLLKTLRNIETVKEGAKLNYFIRRATEALKRAWFVTKNLERKGVNMSNVEGKLQDVKSLLDEARSLLASGDVNETKSKLNDVRMALREVYREIGKGARGHLNLTREKVVKRIKFIEGSAERCIAKLELLENRLKGANRTNAANRVDMLKNKILQTLESLHSHMKNGERQKIIGDVRALIRYLRFCRGFRH